MQEQSPYTINLPSVWPDNNIFLVDISGKKISISKIGENYFGYSDFCPHAGVSFSQGGILVKECVIVCPLHGYKFDIRNGRNITGEDYKLKTYRVNISGNNLNIFLY